MNIKPLYARIIIRKLSSEKTVGGILLPGKYVEDCMVGEVVAIGPNAENIKLGEKILYGMHTGAKIDIAMITRDLGIEFDYKSPNARSEYLVLQDEDVIANLDQFFKDGGLNDK